MILNVPKQAIPYFIYQQRNPLKGKGHKIPSCKAPAYLGTSSDPEMTLKQQC